MSARTFIDTNILVYAHDTSAAQKHEVAKNLITNFWQTGGARLSIQVLQELYVTLTRKARGSTPESARKLIEDYSHWHIHRPNPSDIIAAISLQQIHQLSFRDAMIIQSAASLGCTHMLSEDLNAGQNIAGVQVSNPFH
jgi:predicted nucleic acid-binding protein